MALANRAVVDFARELEIGLPRMKAPLLHLHLASRKHSGQVVESRDSSEVSSH